MCSPSSRRMPRDRETYIELREGDEDTDVRHPEQKMVGNRCTQTLDVASVPDWVSWADAEPSLRRASGS
jgi:hypothetical protein